MERFTGVMLFIAVLCCTNVHAQHLREKSIKTSLGMGAHMGNNTDGIGFAYSIGYEQEIWNERFKINPNISFGQYNSKFLPLDARDQFFNSTNLELNLFFDLTKSEAFSLVLVGGGLLNYTNGMLGEGGDPENYPEGLHSEYVNDFHIAANMGAGFRINSLGKRSSLNILPLNIHVGTNGFLEFSTKVELAIK
ncbi:MAG: hypothetical protein JW735_01180 [Prolixibacteraceae bacterium]|jgi:hypothetical protein|nr:hypothetical protein [Prolixibacteraceae bacterium]